MIAFFNLRCFFMKTLFIKTIGVIWALLMPCIVYAQPVSLLDCPAAQQLCNLNTVNVPNGVWGPGNLPESGTCMLTGEVSSHWYVFTCTQSGTFNFSCTPTGFVDYDFAFFNITGSAPGTCNISGGTQLACNYALTTGTTGIGCGGVGCTPTQNLIAGNTYAILINRFTAGSIIGFNLTFSGTAQIGAPQSSITAPTVCLGSPTLFSITNAPTGSYVYNWNFGNGSFSALANPTHTYANPGTYNVTLQITSTTGNTCMNQNLTATVTVSDAPEVSINPATQTVCPGQSATLDAIAQPPAVITAYSWTPATGLSATTGNTVSAAPLQTTTYTVQVSDATGCTNNATAIVTVGSNLTINASTADPSICPGEQTTLSVSGASNYTWSPADGLNTTTGSTVTAAPGTSTTYTATGTDANGCSATSTVSIDVLPLPVITINPSAPTICTGQSASLTASGANTYSWLPNTAINNPALATVTVNPTTNTTYTITGTSAEGCIAQQTVNVTVVNLPSISVSPNNPFVCSGAAATMSASGADTYTWAPNTALNSTAGTTVTASPTITTTYTVVGTLTSGCTASTTVVVNLGNNPTVTVNPSTSTLCDGSNINITAFGAATYSWSPANTLNNALSATVVANPTANTTYTVIGTAANGCTSSATTEVSLVMPVQVAASASASIICPGNIVTLTAQNVNQYSWLPAGGTGQFTDAYAVTPQQSTTYTVTGTDANGCTSSATLSLQVLNPPQITASNNNTLICEGDFTTLTAGGAQSYTWTPFTSLSAGTGASVTANPTATITYTVNGVDANGCSASATVVVNIDPLPVAAFSVDPESGCDPLLVNFTNNSTNALSYSWVFDNGQFAQSENALTVYTIGTFYPRLIATNTAGCSDTALFSTGITVYPPPVADFSSSPDTGVLMKYTEALVTFTNLSQGAETYLWNFGDGNSSNLDNPEHQYLSQGNYFVSLLAISAQGCTADITKGPYEVEGMPPVFVPNTFTPNGDGANDVLRVFAIGLKEFDLRIYDRWGTLVFASRDINTTWDGTYNGRRLNSGVYIYQLQATLQNDDPLLKYGDVNLLR